MKNFQKSIILLHLCWMTISAFTPTRDVHLSCQKVFEYILAVECELPSDTSSDDIVRIDTKNITSDLPLKLSPKFMTEHIPQGIGSVFSGIEELHIWRAKLKYIDRESFNQMNALKKLDLSDNEIESVPSDVFYELNMLEEIILDKNAIKLLDENLLLENKKLTKFSAENNAIEVLPRGLFRNNLAISWISFIRNQLKIVEINFGELKNIQTIGLGGNFDKCDFNYRSSREITKFQDDVNSFCKNN